MEDESFSNYLIWSDGEYSEVPAMQDPGSMGWKFPANHHSMDFNPLGLWSVFSVAAGLC